MAKLPASLVFPFHTAFCAARGLCAAASQANRAAGRLRRQLTPSANTPPLPRPGAPADCQSAVVCQRADQRVHLRYWESSGRWIFDGEYNRQLCSRPALIIFPTCKPGTSTFRRTLPWNGSAGMLATTARGASHLDITSAPRPTSTSHIFNYEQSAAYSKVQCRPAEA